MLRCVSNGGSLRYSAMRLLKFCLNDQVIPGSRLVAYLNADHWALAVPIARSHATIGAAFVTQNGYPREALTEALLRFIEEDLSNDDWTRQ